MESISPNSTHSGSRHFLQRGPLLIFWIGFGFRKDLEGTLVLSTRVETGGIKRFVGGATSCQAQPEDRQHKNGKALLHV